MSRDRDRQRQRARRKEPIPQRRVILAVCEGSGSEPDYLNGFVAACQNPRFRVKTVPYQGNPVTLVEEAIRLRDAAIGAQDYDAVWCVFDVDDHLVSLCDAARRLADQNSISLAISNPAFELWLLLHFAEPPGQSLAKQLLQKLRKHVPHYHKHVDYPGDGYANGYETAVARAKKLDERAESVGKSGHNPTTGVYRLTESIRTE